MNTKFFGFRSLAGIGGALALFLTPHLAFAQQNYNPVPSPAAPKPAEKEDAPYELEIVDGWLRLDPLKPRMELPDALARAAESGEHGVVVRATLDKIVMVLRELHPSVNIVSGPGADNVTVMDVKIRSVRHHDALQLREELQALEVASGAAFAWHTGMEDSEIDPLTGKRSNGNGQLFIVTVDAEKKRKKAKREIEVFNMSEYIRITHIPQEEVQGNLNKVRALINETLVKLQGEDFISIDAVTFEFHPGSNLLIAIGPSASLDVARKVLDAMPGSATSSNRFSRYFDTVRDIPAPGEAKK